MVKPRLGTIRPKIGESNVSSEVQVSKDVGADREAPGLALAPKLKREHVYLTSFSKMRVDLATQVTSSSLHRLAKALCLLGRDLTIGIE